MFKRSVSVFAALTICAALASCYSPQKSFIDAMEATIDAVQPDLEAYWAADQALRPEQKVERAKTFTLARKAIATARGAPPEPAPAEGGAK